ncbi:uncharacterized protein LOC106875913 [Octopus bimaculoides]|nr:uncharacterized protein LOC106875913 [Octopus bimaculoides]
MRFHHVHGSAVTLSNNRLHANRDEKHFCDGIVFGDQPLKIGVRISLQMTCITTWKGALRIGVTSNDPQCFLEQHTLPRYLYPDLVKQEGYWARLVNEKFAVSYHIITFYVNSMGELQLFVNNHYIGVLLNGIPTHLQLWFLLDLYGNTSAVKLVITDDTPKEIFVRGEAAIKAYEKACCSGSEAVYRTRLMLVGKDRVGKTSLKRSLLGQKDDQPLESTDGVDLSESCSFNTSDSKAWRLNLNGENVDKEQHQKTDAPRDIIGGVAALEEEFTDSTALNVYLEMVLHQKEKELKNKNNFQKNDKKTEKENRSYSTMLGCSTGSKVSPGAVTQVPQQLLKGIQADAIEKLQAMLEVQSPEKWIAENQCEKICESIVEIPQQEVTLDIWDFAGQAVYYTTHQVTLNELPLFLVLCMNLTFSHIYSKSLLFLKEDQTVENMSNLGYIDYWMKSIHAHSAESTKNTITNSTLSPPMFIVGTHRNSLNDDQDILKQMVKEKFNALEEFLIGKPYYKHIIKPFFAVENYGSEDEEDVQICLLREHIQKVALQEPYMGEKIPTRWLQFEDIINQLIDNCNNYASIDQVADLALDIGIEDEQEVQTMLDFYHDLGVIIYYGGSLSAVDNILRSLVILNLQWLVEMFRRVITANYPLNQDSVYVEKRQQLEKYGLLDEQLINYLWNDELEHKAALLGLLQKFDLICKRIPSKVDNSKGASYYVPSMFHLPRDNKKLHPGNSDVVTFYLNFHGFLPEALFHRILAHTLHWSQECGGSEPYLYYRVARLFLDSEHDFILEMLPSSYAKVKVVVMRVAEAREEDVYISDNGQKAPLVTSPQAVAKVRNFLDTTLLRLREVWMKRISYSTSVSCPCGQLCDFHHISGCTAETCLHFLDLDECLSKKVICCGHRRMKTTFVQKWFPPHHTVALKKTILSNSLLESTKGNFEKEITDLPYWIKSAAKLLNNGVENLDWVCLANYLGYKKPKIDKFNNDLNPSLALLTDWILGSGNTQVSVDVLHTFLEKMSRYDIIDLLKQSREQSHCPQVFISYQWDSQDAVKALWDRLERAGISCWMDIGQMGGGDQLYNKIEQGIRNCKIILACVTPKYVISHLCNRELSLADGLRKPILPVMFESIVWPPPGGMALIFSNLVYIDMNGIGGHGSSGMTADLADKYKEIIHRISHYFINDENSKSTTESKSFVPSSVKSNQTSNEVNEVTPSIETTHEEHHVGSLNPHQEMNEQLTIHNSNHPRTLSRTNVARTTSRWRCGLCNVL